MIANGSGIAPFRSIAEYVAGLSAEKRNYLRLYLFIYEDIMVFSLKMSISISEKNGNSYSEIKLWN